MVNSTRNLEPTYTLAQLMQMIRYTRHSQGDKAGKPVYTDKSHVAKSFTRACERFKATHGHDALREEYLLCRKKDAFTKDFIDRAFAYWPKVLSSRGVQLKVVDYSQASSHTPSLTVPPVNPDYTARIVEAANRVNEERERAHGQSPFDRIRHVDQHGEWWDARELQGILGYDRWENFENAIEKAKLSLNASDGLEADHFRDITKMVGLGSGATRPVNSYRLSRHACHLVAQNGDPSKPEIAAAQRYFSVQTRRAELMDAGLSSIERTAHIDALVSGQQQLTAAVDEIGENQVKVLTVIESMQHQLESLKAEILSGVEVTVKKYQTPAEADLKRLHGNLYQQVLEQSYRYPDGIHCPCCNKATTAWEVDHWNSKTNPARTNGWKICRPCNQALGAAGDNSKRHQYKARFDAFHVKCDDYEQYLKGDEVQMDLL